MSQNNHQELVQDQQQEHLVRQIQFQRALEQNLRSYIIYAQQQNKLHLICLLILSLSIYQIVEIILCIISVIISKQRPIFIINMISIGIDVISLIPLIYYSNLFHQNEIEFLEGLLWFQYDIEQKPNYEITQIMQKSNCFCIYINYVSMILQICLLILIILGYIKFKGSIQDLPIVIELSYQLMIITRLLLLLFGIIAIIINLCQKKEYTRIYTQITSLQELEYEQYSPLNKYLPQVITPELQNLLAQLQCIICLHDFLINEETIKLNCHQYHIFHKKCLQEWVNLNSTCPTCRANI